MIAPLSPSIIERFYGKPLDRTIRGYAYLENDEVQALFGLYYDRPCQRWVAFMEVKPEVRSRITSMRCKRALLRGGALLVEMVKRTPGHVQAAAAGNIDQAPAFLERLGFKHLTANVYWWPRG